MAHGDGDGVTHDLVSLLGSGDRDFLVRNNGEQVTNLSEIILIVSNQV